MSLIDAILRFPPDWPSDEWRDEYRVRYRDGELGWGAAHWDDVDHTRRRKASISDGSIDPIPVYNGPEPAEGEPDMREIIALEVECGWPEQFIIDLRNNAYPDFFAGITEITED